MNWHECEFLMRSDSQTLKAEKTGGKAMAEGVKKVAESDLQKLVRREAKRLDHWPPGVPRDQQIRIMPVPLKIVASIPKSGGKK